MEKLNLDLDLNNIEIRLEKLIHTDKKRWVEIYELMDYVSTTGIFKPKYSSFTQWVNAMAVRYKVHVSLLWERNKAGRFYKKYQDAMEKKGTKAKDLNEINATSENLSLIEKISRGNMEIAADLIDKVDRNELQRKDLKNAWAMVKKQQRQRGITLASNGYEKKKQSDQFTLDEASKEGQEKALTALELFRKIEECENWFGQAVEKKGVKNKKRYFSEFAIDSGSSRHARRIDLLLAETITTNHPREVRIHAVEIKVDKNDLINDHKMNEYTDFCDSFWIAVPSTLKEEALNLMLPSWGLLLYDENDNQIVVEKAAIYNPGVLRNETITTALTKLM